MVHNRGRVDIYEERTPWLIILSAWPSISNKMEQSADSQRKKGARWQGHLAPSPDKIVKNYNKRPYSPFHVCSPLSFSGTGNGA